MHGPSHCIYKITSRALHAQECVGNRSSRCFCGERIGVHEMGSHFFALISIVKVVITAVVNALVMLYGHRLPSCGRGGEKGYFLDIYIYMLHQSGIP